MTPIHRFFGGKGGVGKTTCAVAAALKSAAAGKRVLIVSTDPAHSLGDALGKKLSYKPAKVRARLTAVELDADRALERWLRSRKEALELIAQHGTYLDAEDIQRLLEMSLPGVDEMLGLVELRRLSRGASYDEVIVDTAPTGHTLRLLAIPETWTRIASVFDDMQAKHRFLAESIGGSYRDDAGDKLIAEIDSDGREMAESLRDPVQTTFTWVLLPETLSLAETKDGIAGLEQEGIAVQEIIVNRVVKAAAGACALCKARARAEKSAIAKIKAAFPKIRITMVSEHDEPGRPPKTASAVRGASATRARHSAAYVALDARPTASAFASAARGVAPRAAASDARHWAAALAPDGCRVLMFAGKGGVGKTTCAATAALTLADMTLADMTLADMPRAAASRKRKVLLLSTDPAHSLADVLDTPLGDDERPVPGYPQLHAREIDAQQIFRSRRESYQESISGMFDALQRGSRSGVGVDVAYDHAVARGLIDLSPPGIDEIFGILSVSEALNQYDLVVVDTAPTGHALRLLEMPEMALEWVRTLLSILLKYKDVTGLGSLATDLLDTAKQMRGLLELLRDRSRTAMIVVTRPAELPRLETERLLRHVMRLKIAVAAILVNAVTPESACPRCKKTAQREQPEIAAITAKSPGKLRKLLAPMFAPPPVGAPALLRWGRSWNESRT